MKNLENGMSIVQLEERYEMAAEADSDTTVQVHGGEWWGVGVVIPF